MLIEFGRIAELSSLVGHHAILLTSNSITPAVKDDPQGGLPFAWFAAIAKHFCGIEFSEASNEETSWEHVSRNSDVFVADRTRPILRLEEVAPLSQLAMYPAQNAKRRLFFIDRCGRLNQHATNSLLKLLEEPLVPCLFLLTAGRASEVLPTIVSRCFRLQAKLKTDQNRQAEADLPPLDESDWHLLCQQLSRVVNAEPVTLNESLWTTNGVSGQAVKIHEIVSLSEKLAKQYQADELQGAIIRFVAEAWEGKRQSSLPPASLRAQMRFILSDLRQWRDAKPYHPSSAHWLTRILLKSVV